MSEFVDFLKDLLQPLGPVRARKMFGGYGLYLDGLMFALVADDCLYLKVDDQTREHFTALGLEPFTFDKKGKPVAMSYYQAPEIMLDEPE